MTQNSGLRVRQKVPYAAPMPVISAFYGMLIRIYHADHNPPHFHVQYGEMNAIVQIPSEVYH